MLPSLIDRLGDAKDSVREQDQALLLKIMDQAANPQVRRGGAGSGPAGGRGSPRRAPVGFRGKLSWCFIWPLFPP